MKKLMQIIAVLFMIAGTLAGGAKVFGENNSLSPEKGDLTIHKYLYDEAGVPGGIANGKEITDPNVTNALDKPIANVPFDVYQITGKDDNAAPDEVPGNAGLAANQAKWVYSLDNGKLKVTNGTNTYEYTLKTPAFTGSTDGNGVLKFPELERGQYLVVENLSRIEASNPPTVNGNTVSITKPTAPFVVDVPMTDPDDLDKWITDVHVYPKNQSTEVIKTPEAPSYDIGKEVGWKIDVELPNDIKDYKQLTVTDVLDEALSFVDPSVEIFKAEKNSNGNWVKVNPSVNLPASDFEVTVPTEQNANTITINIKKDENGTPPVNGFATMDGWEGMIIEFKTIINEKVVESPNVNIVENEVSVEFKDKNDVVTDKDSDKTEVNIGEIEPKKVDENKKSLKDAEFQIADTEANVNDAKYLKVVVDKDGKITRIVRPSDGDYATVGIPWIVRTGLTVASEENGQWYFPTFRGMASHNKNKDPFSYWLVETKAPNGYNLLGDSIEVTFDTYDASKTVQHKRATAEIINKRGFELPKTGSWLTILLTILGIVMLGLGIMSSMNKDKKKKSKA